MAPSPTLKISGIVYISDTTIQRIFLKLYVKYIRMDACQRGNKREQMNEFQMYDFQELITKEYQRIS